MTHLPSQAVAWIPRLARVAVWTLLAACVAIIALRQNVYQWDLDVFQESPGTLDTGANPYNKAARNLDLADHVIYVYPPILLYLFKPLGLLSDSGSYLLWLGLKLVALAYLLRLWHRNFQRLDFSWPVVLFIACGLNGTLLRDVASGNIAIFEQLGLWGAFALLLRGRPYWAALLLAATAQFKLLPVVFMALIPVVGPARGWKPLAVGVGAFAALLSLNYLVLPEFTMHFLRSFADFEESLDNRGVINPSMLAQLRDIEDRLGSHGIPEGWSYAAYLGSVALLGAAGLWFVSRRYRALARIDQRYLVFAACALFALTMPRMKDYSYVLLLIPALFVVKRHVYATPLTFVAVLMLFAAPDTYVPLLNIVVWQLRIYFPLYAAAVLLYFLVWEMVAALRRVDAGSQEDADESAPGASKLAAAPPPIRQ